MNVLGKSNKYRFGHEAISSHIEVIERIYSNSNVNIGNSHQLIGLLNDAKDIVAEWANGNLAETDMHKFFNLLHIDRIYSGLQILAAENNKDKYLKDLLNGTLNFFHREISTTSWGPSWGRATLTF